MESRKIDYFNTEDVKTDKYYRREECALKITNIISVENKQIQDKFNSRTK